MSDTRTMDCPDCNKTVRMDEIHCVQEPAPTRCRGDIIQTDAKSFLAFCDRCGDGATTTTRRKAEKWVAAHDAGASS